MSKLKERYEGKTFKSNNYGDFVVLEYVDKNNVTIKFNRTGGTRKTTTASILNGNVLDYYAPSVFGVGVVDGEYKHLGNFKTEEDAFLVYKKFKEAHFKSLAEKWKDSIDVRVYEALMNWEVSVDD